MQDSKLTATHLATYFNVAPRPVLKRVQEASLLGFKVPNQWRFQKAMVDTWLDDQRIGHTTRCVEPGLPDSPANISALSTCFEATSLRELQRLLRDLEHEKRLDVQQARPTPWRPKAPRRLGSNSAR